MIFSTVSRTSFISCRLAPSVAKPIGTPCPSVNRLRFAPFFPGQWDSCPSPHRPGAPWSSLRPCSTKPNQCLSVRRTRTQLGLIQRQTIPGVVFPLAKPSFGLLITSQKTDAHPVRMSIFRPAIQKIIHKKTGGMEGATCSRFVDSQPV